MTEIEEEMTEIYGHMKSCWSVIKKYAEKEDYLRLYLCVEKMENLRKRLGDLMIDERK